MIKVDAREDSSRIGEILAREYGVNAVRETLRVGDYVINGEIVVERKTTVDFVRSIIDGRLFKQVAGMKRFFDFVFFIIEGKELYNTGINIHPHAIKGALVSLALAWQAQVFFTESAKETALFLSLIDRQKALVPNEYIKRPGRRPKRQRKRQLYILQSLPAIGPKLAIELLNYFGSVEAVFTAEVDKLTEISGLGKITAEKIKKVVSKNCV